MGVSLERVQNKFACIIGELCSEPIVLSQFAVWVDLRIAEYKTNGTISLDCSGDSPNPIWMKGVKTAPQRGSSNSMDTGQGHHRRRGSYTNSPSLQSPSASPLSNQMYNERLPSADNQNSSSVFPSRLSPEIVVIKEEPSSDPSSCSLSRKRQSEGDLQSDYYSPAKSRRHGNASFSSPAQESSSNQSLMSIINTETDTITVEPVKNEDDIFKVTMEMQDELNQSQGLPPITSSNSTFSPRRPSATATSTSNSPNQSAWPTSYVNDPQQGTSSQAGSKKEVFVGIHGAGLCKSSLARSSFTASPGHSSSHSSIDYDYHKIDVMQRKRRIVNIADKSLTTIKHLVAALGQVEWWLKESPRNEYRKIEDLPPVELNDYLADFFETSKKVNGDNFGATYFARLRSSLERHLKEHEYPVSIVKSPMFLKSQKAFRKRLKILNEQYNCITGQIVHGSRAIQGIFENTTKTVDHYQNILDTSATSIKDEAGTETGTDPQVLDQ